MSYILKESDVYDFAATLNIETKSKGNELFFKHCPYCNGGDSNDKYTFSINLDNGAYKCFRASCGMQGHFVELARDFDFKLAFEENRKHWKRLPQKKPSENAKAIEYLAGRGIGRAVTNCYRITTDKKNSNILVFPFYDESDYLTCIKYRKTNFDKNKDKNKEWFEKDTKPILFGMAQCTDFDRLIITEGQIDSLSVAECGINNAVSVPNGAMGFTWLQNVWEWIIKFNEVIVFGDYEKGKMTLIDELKVRLPQTIKAVRPEDYLGEKDANDILRKYGKQAIETCINNAQIPTLENVKRISDVKAVDMNLLPKIKTNIKEIDRVIGGLYFGQVILLTGKRGHGKSTFMSQLVGESLEQDYGTFVYSGELADYHFKRWLDFQLAGSSYIETNTNEYGDPVYSIGENVITNINRWYSDKAFIYDNNYIGDAGELESLTDTVEKVIKQYGVKLVCIDNLMTAIDVSEQNSLHLAQSNFVGKLKKIAMKYNVAVILVAHPRKSNSEFTNDDVSGSSDITNKVDIVMSYERIDGDELINGRLSITKNRLGGKLATGNKAIDLIYSDKTKRIFSKTSGIRHYGWEDEAKRFCDVEFI